MCLLELSARVGITRCAEQAKEREPQEAGTLAVPTDFIHSVLLGIRHTEPPHVIQSFQGHTLWTHVLTHMQSLLYIVPINSYIYSIKMD